MVKVRLLEVPPPGPGLVTVTCAVPTFAMSAAVIAACTCEPRTNVVVRFEPFHFTCELDTNPVPCTVRVKSVPPCFLLVGLSEVRFGTGLLIAKVTALEVPPPGAGFVTVTEAVPALAIFSAGTVTVS